MAGTTTGEVGVTTYSAGETPWDHTSGLQALDDAISDLMHGKLRNEIVATDLDATPSCIKGGAKGCGVMVLSNTGATNITDFDDGTDEQFLIVRATTANSTIVHDGTNITTRSGSSITLAADQYICFQLDGTEWKEVWGGFIAASSLAAGSITATALKFATVSGSLAALSGLSGSAGVYYHWPELSSTSNTNWGRAWAPTVGIPAIINPSATVALGYVWGFHSTSPPWHVDGEEWGSFMFVHRRKSDGEVLSSSLCVDPPWQTNPELRVWGKNDPIYIQAQPHPFIFGDGTKDPPPGTEVVLIDLREGDLADDEFSMEMEQAKALRNRAAAEVSVGGSMEKVLEFNRQADAKELSARPAKAKGMYTRLLRARIEGKNPGVELAKLDIVKNASNEVKRNNKALRTGASNFDSKIIIVGE